MSCENILDLVPSSDRSRVRRCRRHRCWPLDPEAGSGPPPTDRNQRSQDMNCLVCGAKAELIDVTIDGVSIACPRCGEYDVSGLTIGTGQMERLKPEQRRDVLEQA